MGVLMGSTHTHTHLTQGKELEQMLSRTLKDLYGIQLGPQESREGEEGMGTRGATKPPWEICQFVFS